MANEPSSDRSAQCSVPNITLSNEMSRETTISPGPTTPNTPVVLLAKPFNSSVAISVAQPSPGAVEPSPSSVSLLPRPLSAPTSMVSSSSSPAPSSSGAGPTRQSETGTPDVDSPIVEALKSSKDRLYVLKLGETMESLISQGKLYAKVELQPASSYQRLLVYRCAEFYHLTQESSPSGVAVIVTTDSRIPSKRIAELVPPEESVLPAFQIMRRVDRSKTASRATSVDGNLTDDGDESTKSQGSNSKRKHMTIEEREVAYNKARSRIFMDFDEKDASVSSGGAISSAASTVSYTGGSTGMSSSVDGDGASTAPTESEYSAPAGRGKDSWYGGSYGGNNGRGMQNNNGPGSTLRSTAPPFSSPNVAPPPPKGMVHYLPPMQDSNSNPDMTSSHPQPPPGAPPAAPGFQPYPQPAIYPFYVPYYYPMPYPQPVAPHLPPTQPAPSSEAPRQDPQQSQQQPPPPGYIPNQAYPGYTWVPVHPGYIPVPPPQPNGLPPGGIPMPPPPAGTNISRPASQASHQSGAPFDQRGQPLPPPPVQQQGNPYPGYPAPPNAFPPSNIPQSMQGNPNVPPGAMPMMHSAPAGHPQQPMPPFVPHQGPTGPPPQPGNGPWNNQYPPPGPNMSASRPASRGMGPQGPGRPPIEPNRAISNASAPGGPKRSIPPRNPWGAYSYGPGIGVGGMHTTNPSQNAGPSVSGPPPIGPNGAVLRAPEGLNIRILPPITHDSHSTGGSSGSSGSLRKRNVAATGILKSPGDETSSVTSSSSSSSKRTFTSTASSQPQHHPLPERPDWVLGNRPQPGGTMHPRRTPNMNANRPLLGISPGLNSSTVSTSSISAGTASSSASSVSGADSLSKEFPPLESKGSGSGQISRSKTPASPQGAWNNLLTRPGSAGVAARPDTRLDEPDKKFERPPPKSGVALFNPRDATARRSKSGDRSNAQNKVEGQANGNIDGITKAMDATILVDKDDATLSTEDGAASTAGSAGSGTSFAATSGEANSNIDSMERRASVEC